MKEVKNKIEEPFFRYIWIHNTWYITDSVKRQVDTQIFGQIPNLIRIEVESQLEEEI